MHPFRIHHLLSLFAEYDKSRLPLDRAMADYFRAHKALGSKDRGYIAETAYALMRWRDLLDAHLAPPYTWEKRLELLDNVDHDDEALAPHTRLSFPQVLYDLLVSSWGEAKAREICRVSNTQAPITIRANLLKTTRDELLRRLMRDYDVVAGLHSPTAIHFLKREPLFTLPEFKEGLFEMQDEASQLIAGLVDAKPGDHVLDFCSGSGGKTLAFAPGMQGQGQIYLHDIRQRALDEAKQRLRRAGIQNVQFVKDHSDQLKRLKKKCDWVLVDAPCTGTGTLRRNPDMKWRFDEETLPRLTGTQRTIFEQALSYLKPGGKIVYATCSVLKAENDDQIKHFLATYPVILAGEPMQIFPTEGGMDGFYGATLCKN